jgi:hypothetical protein
MMERRWGVLSQGVWAVLLVAVVVIGCVVAVLLGTPGAAVAGASSAAAPSGQQTTQTASETQIEHPSSTVDGTGVSERVVRIGMTAEQVRESWGPPDEVTRSSSEAGAYERWAYFDAGVYLHFQAGVLFGIQD